MLQFNSCTFVHQPSDESDPNHGRIWQAEQKSFPPRFSSFLWQRSEQNDRTPPIREESADTTQRDTHYTHTANSLNTSYRFQMLNVDDITNHSTVNQPLNCWKNNWYVLFCLRLGCLLRLKGKCNYFNSVDDGVVSENMAHCEHDAALNASRYNLGAVLLCNLRKHNKT